MMQMIGIAFGTPTEFEKTQYGVRDEIRFARIELGPEVSTSNGKIVGPHYWRKWELPLEEKTELAEKVLEAIKAHRPREITGFTLFYNESKYTKADGTLVEPGFQMSVRRKDENGWDVQRITKEQASVVFRLLENSGHPDGPWTLVESGRVDVRDSYIVPQSAVEGWPPREKPQELEYFDEGSNLVRTDEWPYAKAREEEDLLSLLGRAEEAVRGRTVAQATILPEKP